MMLRTATLPRWQWSPPSTINTSTTLRDGWRESKTEAQMNSRAQRLDDADRGDTSGHGLPTRSSTATRQHYNTVPVQRSTALQECTRVGEGENKPAIP